MSGTFIVSEWHLVSFRVPIVCPSTTFPHISSTVISATGQPEVTRSMDDSQSSCESAKGVFCQQVVSLDRSNLDGSKMDGQRQTATDESKDAIGHRRLCHI